MEGRKSPSTHTTKHKRMLEEGKENRLSWKKFAVCVGERFLGSCSLVAQGDEEAQSSADLVVVLTLLRTKEGKHKSAKEE